MWSDPGVAAAVERAAIRFAWTPMRGPTCTRDSARRPPSTAVLTADAQFVRGGTFLSPVQCLGFLDAALADWRAGRLPAPRPEPKRGAAPLRAAGPASPGDPGDSGAAGLESPAARLVDEVVERLRRRADLVHGGFGVAPKLPDSDAVTLLLRRGAATGDRALLHIARLTLDAIAEHLVDPDDGGFFRYAAAADWSGRTPRSSPWTRPG